VRLEEAPALPERFTRMAEAGLAAAIAHVRLLAVDENSVKTVLREAAGGQLLDRVVQLAQRHLDMDVAFIAAFGPERNVYRAVAGDAAAFALEVGQGPATDGTYCALMVTGAIPNLIPDTSVDERVRQLAVTSAGAVGAYVGVPLRLPDGTLYGSLCCLSHRAQPELTSRDVKFMSMLAELLEEELAEQTRLDQQRLDLDDILASGNVTMALQPVVDLMTGRCTSLEALARFPAAIGAPDVAFAAADQVGLRLRLETLTASKALALLSVLAPDQALAINLSPDVAFQLAATATRRDLPWSRIILEMTEHAAVESYTAIRERLQPLRERGLRLAIDDAGAGFASLRHIVELRPDIIKIDRSLVDGVVSDLARRSVVTNFVLLALDIGAVVVAEGVETQAELDAVSALGVDAVQGYLIARPSSDRDDLARWASGTPLLPTTASAALPKPRRSTPAASTFA
jgi:EAL domain-containing protein (putative c-di-GMP-specific phosphodiesterase class I)